MINRHIGFYPGSPLMITINKGIRKGRGNGILCRGISVKLKKNSDIIGWLKMSIIC